jgi:predicted dehydrogenase
VVIYDLSMYKLGTILLIGAGYMAREYVKVLKAMKVPFVVVGRSEKSVKNFEKENGIKAVSGGLKKWLKNNICPTTTIVAVTEDQLGIVTRQLLNAGCKNILVEKPGGFDNKDIINTEAIRKRRNAKVYVAYNRRFYASTQKALELIKNEGVLSFNFDFTERSYLVEKATQSDKIKREWFLHNSTHVIDMAFFIGGWPKKLLSQKNDRVKWHPAGAIYVGHGISDKGASFAYHANWKSAGRWSVEIMTPKGKLIFRPLEKLQVQKYGEMNVEYANIDDQLDIKFKPGLYSQIESFLGDKKNLLTLNEQVEHLKYYRKINS